MWALSVPTLAQETCRWYYPRGDTLVLSPTTILPQSIHFPFSQKIDYQLLENQKGLRLYPPIPDSLYVCFVALPYDLLAGQSRRSQSSYDAGRYQSRDSTAYRERTFAAAQQPREEILPTSGLQKTGSLSRGISVGNRQDVFVNSNLNLQLEGEITEGVYLSALISDQNIPFQPEGNTQQLQEFDRIELKLTHKSGELKAGDVLFENKDDHFLRYYKNVSGVQLNTHYADSSQTYAGISLAKGQFASGFLAVQEGVQGPYRLSSDALFVIVIAGSEQVYLDGKKLERGFNQDYTIDYNAAEITFTSRVLITQFSRLWVQYEYAAQNYSRTITHVGHIQNFKNWQFRIKHYQERDNARNPLFGRLGEQERLLLESAGRQTVQAGTARPVAEFSPDQILYRRRDTLWQGQQMRIFERALGDTPDSLFSVEFLPSSRGDYTLSRSTANGRVFVWAGIGQGSHSPLTVVPAPNQRQMTTFYAEYRLDSARKVFAEFARSDQDPNLLSRIGNAQNRGQAFRIGYAQDEVEHTHYLGLRDVRTSWGATLEYNSKYFSGIDRFRDVEFDRDWSADLSLSSQDRIATLYYGIAKDEENLLDYQGQWRERGSFLSGLQHRLRAYKRWGAWGTKAEVFRMQSRQPAAEQRSEWWRWEGQVFWRSPYVVAGYMWSGDQNAVRTEDSVRASAMYFEAQRWYLTQGDSSAAQWELAYERRRDFLPDSGRLLLAARTQTLTASGKRGGKINTIAVQMIYRKLSSESQEKLQSEETLQGRIDWRGNWLNKVVRSQLTFTTSTGQEPQREFVFLPVETGIGTHTWRDDNQDGLQDLNEFYEAINPDERNYVKIWRPTQNFAPAYSSSIAYQWQVRPPMLWRKKKGLLLFFSKLSTLLAWQSSVRASETKAQNRLTSLWKTDDDQNLLSREESLRGQLFFNRTATDGGAQLGYQRTARKDLLTNGFEGKAQQQWQLVLRKQMGQNYNLQLFTQRERQILSSDFLENRNFDILAYRLRPELAWQPNPFFRLAGAYRWEQKQADTLRAQIHETTLQVRQNKPDGGTLQAEARWLSIQYNAPINNALGYQMLEALQPGSNFTWQIDWQQKILNGLRLTLAYQGRKSPQQPVVHMGRVQLTALF